MALMRKNFAVGATMLAALILLGVMIVRFGDAPVKWFKGSQIPVSFSSDTAEGISNGSPIFYLGVNVGKVDYVALTPDGTRVLIQGSVEKSRQIPANVEGLIRGSLIGGSSSLNLQVIGDPPVPQGALAANASLIARAGGSNLLPKEVGELAKRLSALSERLEVTVAQLNESGVIKKLGSAVDSIRETVTKAGVALDDAHKLIGDPKIQSDIQATLANFREVSENARSITKNLDKLTAETTVTVTTTHQRIEEISKSLGERLSQTAGVLDKFQSIATKIDKGEGTAGKLINDPKLYESLTATSQELNLTIKDLRRLVEQWEQEGVTLKLGGKK